MPHIVKCRSCGLKFRTLQHYDEHYPFAPLGWFVECMHCRKASPSLPAAARSDLKFGYMAPLAKDDVLASIPATGCLAVPAKAFRDNINRILAIGQTPDLFAAQYALFTGHLPQGTIHIRGSMTPEIIAQMQEEAVQEFFFGSQDFDVDDWFKRSHSKASRLVFEGLIGAMLTGTWTAFETLAGDLWETALNVHPKDLADLGGSYLRIHRAAEKRLGRSIADPHKPKKIGTPGKVALWGKYHREHDIVRFSSLRAIRAAYSLAFKKRHAAIDKALSAPALDVLSYVRNLLVHRGGVVDRQYRDATKSIRGCPRASIGRKLFLRGDRAGKLIQTVIRASIAMLQAVSAEVDR